MAKIPQGEWNAIAARYAQGESISRIAQSYGCTPPAIHYILKRNRQQGASSVEQPLNGRVAPSPETTRRPTAPEILRSSETPDADRKPLQFTPGESGPKARQPAVLRPGRDHDTASFEPMHRDRGQPVVALPQPGDPPTAGRASAFTAGLDKELHGRAEAAIEAFRLSFDAALAEGSPVVRQRLRQAASDLMRVAARTTIVLDRLTANAERASLRALDHLRFTRGGEHL